MNCFHRHAGGVNAESIVWSSEKMLSFQDANGNLHVERESHEHAMLIDRVWSVDFKRADLCRAVIRRFYEMQNYPVVRTYTGRVRSFL